MGSEQNLQGGIDVTRPLAPLCNQGVRKRAGLVVRRTIEEALDGLLQNRNPRHAVGVALLPTTDGSSTVITKGCAIDMVR